MSKPIYTELSIYLTALTCIVLFLSHPDFRYYLSNLLERALADGQVIAVIVLVLIAVSGFILSIIHLFTTREKSSVEKYCMGVFAIGANAIASIEAGVETINSGGSIFVIFPVWNIVMGIVAIYQIRSGDFEVTDENYSLLKVIGASITLFIVFGISRFAFNLPWAMTFSICIFYSSSILFLITGVINYLNLRRVA